MTDNEQSFSPERMQFPTDTVTTPAAETIPMTEAATAPETAPVDETVTTPATDCAPAAAFSPDAFSPLPSLENVPPVTQVKRKRVKPIIILAVIAVLVLAALTAAALYFIPQLDTSDNRIITSFLDEDDRRIIVIPNGKRIVIQNSDVIDATLTADRKSIVCLTEDGELYVTDTKQSKQTVLAQDAAKIVTVRDAGCLYEDEDENVYRVLFRSGSVTTLGDVDNLKIATHTLSSVFTDGETVWLLTEKATDPVELDRSAKFPSVPLALPTMANRHSGLFPLKAEPLFTALKARRAKRSAPLMTAILLLSSIPVTRNSLSSPTGSTGFSSNRPARNWSR